MLMRISTPLNVLSDTQESSPVWERGRTSPGGYSGGTSKVVDLATLSFLHPDASVVLDLPRARKFHS